MRQALLKSTADLKALNPTKNINDDGEEAPMKTKKNKSMMKVSQGFSRWAVIFIMK
jgi:hypothetical protein